MTRPSALPLALIVLLVCGHASAADPEQASKDRPGGLPHKPSPQAHKPSKPAAKPDGKAGTPMSTAPAPKSGSMPRGPAPKGKLGTEPTAHGKLGTDPQPRDPSDRPPRFK
jgi:hypothetical protein